MRGGFAGGPGLRPVAQQRLDVQVQLLHGGQLTLQARQRGDVGESLLEEELAENAPVIGVVPDHLGRHDLGIAEHRVLVAIQRERALVEREVDLLEDACACISMDWPARSRAISSVM